MKINLEITVTEEIEIPDEWFEETNGEEPDTERSLERRRRADRWRI